MSNVQVFTSKSKHDDSLYQKIYVLTDYICKFYPGHKDWFFDKFLPGLKSGNRIIVAIFDDKDEPIGTSFLKKGDDEYKICTLFICEDYRKNGIGRRLMEESVKQLEGSDINISVSGVNINQLDSLLSKFGFKLDSKSEGDYLPEETEYYFIRKYEK